jgi:hypothetical protein
MYSHRPLFNGFFICALLALSLGCHTTDPGQPDKKERKELSTLRCCLESSPDGTDRTKIVSVLRNSPVLLCVDLTPVLNENDIAEATVVEVQGSFDIRLKFNNRGTRLLEMVSGSNQGHRLAIYSQFGQERWLAAPKITRLISDGVFEFAPDASREEADRIVRGLNNLVAQMKKRNNF